MIEKNKLTYTKIQNLYKEKEYIFFDKGQYNLNLFAIRSNNIVADSFDDVFGIAYKDMNFMPQIFTCNCTTDPGKYYLKNLMDSGGAAIVVPGQYRNLWQIGTFYNKLALLQISPIKIYRDKNRDEILDLNPKSITEGIYGIFFHYHYQSETHAKYIEKSSAGCIVPQTFYDYRTIMELCVRQTQFKFGKNFTFTLFEENDIL